MKDMEEVWGSIAGSVLLKNKDVEASILQTPVTRLLCEEILMRMRYTDVKNILDLGCLEGNKIRYFKSVLSSEMKEPVGRMGRCQLRFHMHEKNIMGADIFEMKKNTDFKYFRLKNMTDIPLPDNSIDMVYSTGAIFYSPDIRRSIQEVSRVLRQFGFFLFDAYVWNHHEVKRRLLYLVRNKEKDMFGGYHTHYGYVHRKGKLLSALENSGIVIDKEMKFGGTVVFCCHKVCDE